MIMSGLFWRLSKYAFFLFIPIGVMTILAVLILPDSNQTPEIGCYWQKGFIKCRGFAGANYLAAVLSLCALVTVHALQSLILIVQQPGLLLKMVADSAWVFGLLFLTWCWHGLAVVWPVKWLFSRFAKARHAHLQEKEQQGAVDVGHHSSRRHPRA